MQDQNADDQQSVVGAQPEEGEDGDDQGEQQRGDDAADERRPSPGEGRSTEHRSGDAVQGVTAPDLGVADAGTCHHEERRRWRRTGPRGEGPGP